MCKSVLTQIKEGNIWKDVSLTVENGEKKFI